ncbi:quinate permease [Ilyonectria robusta]
MTRVVAKSLRIRLSVRGIGPGTTASCRLVDLGQRLHVSPAYKSRLCPMVVYVLFLSSHTNICQFTTTASPPHIYTELVMGITHADNNEPPEVRNWTIHWVAIVASMAALARR